MNKCCQLLAKKKLKVTFIESASAGYLAYRFSLNKNSGDILNGSLVCYDANLKVSILKISKKFLEKYSPESAEVTEQLVLKAKQIIDSDIFVGCTGLLKRGGSETKEKPVGTFFTVFRIRINCIIIAAYLMAPKRKNWNSCRGQLVRGRIQT